MLRIFKSSFTVNSINPKDLIIKHSRASGKGGQNVNKVNTKVSVESILGILRRLKFIGTAVSYILGRN